MIDLPRTIASRIEKLSDSGNDLVDQDRFKDAIIEYETALSLLPDPKMNWEAWTWLNAAIGDALFLSDNFEEADVFFRQCFKGPDGLDNPFIRLRLGQCARKLGDDEEATQQLLSAYMLDGEDIFKDEEDDLAFLKSRVDLDKNDAS